MQTYKELNVFIISFILMSNSQKYLFSLVFSYM